MKHFVLLLLLLAPAAMSQTIYKCQVNGRTEYSGSPCYSGSEVKRMAPDGGPTPEDQARARMRVQSQIAEQRKRDDDARATAARRAVANEAIAMRPELDRLGQGTRDSEKELVQDVSGWDRKPRGQLREEEVAIQRARALAAAGLPYSDPSRSGMKAGWEQETITEHGVRGWTRKTRIQAVRDAGRAEYEREVARLNAPSPDEHKNRTGDSWNDRDSARDQRGRHYNVNGDRAVVRGTGERCRIDVNDKIRC